MFGLFVVLLLLTYGECLIMPLTNPDGSVNLASVMTHLTMLEQTIENKDTTADVAVLKSQLKTALEELKEVKSDLKNTQTQLSSATATFQSEISALRSQCSCSSTLENQQLANVSSLKTDVSSLKTDVSRLKTDSSKLKTDVFHLQSQRSATGGALYTRWGRTTCPAGNRIVYKGYTGGTYFDNKASSATILCLPDDPIYANHSSSTVGNAGIWGTEYSTKYKGSPFNGILDEDMPCVVCESETRRSVVMVPARNQCYAGWNLEYWGYMMGGYNTHASAEYVCVDKDPEAVAGGHEDKNGQVLYLVESVCGSLPCPPYVNGWELTCVVCTQKSYPGPGFTKRS